MPHSDYVAIATIAAAVIQVRGDASPEAVLVAVKDARAALQAADRDWTEELVNKSHCDSLIPAT